MTSYAHAPGKVIILGEHFVVHGSPALAASIGVGVLAEAEKSKELVVVSEDLNLRAVGPNVVGPLKPIVESVEYLRRRFKLEDEFSIVLRGEIPVSAGLGSSAASSVAAVSAVMREAGLWIGEEIVNEAAMVAERITHGRPSGIDVSIAIRGGIQLFRAGRMEKQVRIKGPVEVIVVESGLRRETSALVQRVYEFKAENPSLFEEMLEEVSRDVVESVKLLESGELEELGRLLVKHHGFLRTLGLSSDAIEEILRRSLESGALGAKITGAGGGGCVIVLPGENSSAILRALKGKFKTHRITLPQGGLSVWSS